MSRHRPVNFQLCNEGISTPSGHRTYVVTRPDAPRPGAPLVILLHGNSGSARQVMGQTFVRSPLSLWLSIADREGLVVAALDGARGYERQQGWNDGRPGAVGNPDTNDVDFVDRLIGALHQQYGIDKQRVYLMGMSNGGLMTFRLALELQNRPAAIAAVCASMPGEVRPALPSKPLPVLMIAGTADPIMPYVGGHVSFNGRPRGATLGFKETVEFWKTTNGLSGDPVVRDIPARRRVNNGTRVISKTWGQPGQALVRLLRVEGGGHTEPSISQRYGFLYRRIAGLQNGDIEAADEAWSFFQENKV